MKMGLTPFMIERRVNLAGMSRRDVFAWKTPAG